MNSNLSVPRLGTIRITVVQRNSRWDVWQDDLPTPVIDCACREDALDYAMGMAARSGDAIVETRDDRGFISRQAFQRHPDKDQVSRIAVVAVAGTRFDPRTAKM